MTDAPTGALKPAPAAQGRSAPADLPLPPPLGLERVAVFLDFDGTLVEIADHPDAVVVRPGLAEQLTRLSRLLDGRLALVTGRTIEALTQHLGPVPVAVAGSHGGQFRADPHGPVTPIADLLPDAVSREILAWAQPFPDLVVEPKPFSIAVHYRHDRTALPALLELGGALAASHGLAMKHGKLVVELTTRGSDKGSAVARFMELAPFAGSTPLFLGDDVTDEDAFVAVDALGGSGILVGDPRPTAAHWRLPGVAAVHAWLDDALKREQPL